MADHYGIELRAPSWAGSLNPKRAAPVIDAYSVAFFRQTIRNETADLLVDETRIYPEVRLKLHSAVLAGVMPNATIPELIHYRPTGLIGRWREDEVENFRYSAISRRDEYHVLCAV
jgi:hypothetical protein